MQLVGDATKRRFSAEGSRWTPRKSTRRCGARGVSFNQAKFVIPAEAATQRLQSLIVMHSLHARSSHLRSRFRGIVREIFSASSAPGLAVGTRVTMSEIRI